LTLKYKKFAVLLVVTAAMSGCQTQNEGSMRASMMIAGVMAGGFIGYNLVGGSDAARAIFSIAGMAAGGAGAQYASEFVIKRDQERRKKAAYRSLSAKKEGVPFYWKNPETGSEGSFKVLRSYKSPEGRRCRELESHAKGGEGAVTKRQTACRIHNGA
jgi:surface antigen